MLLFLCFFLCALGTWLTVGVTAGGGTILSSPDAVVDNWAARSGGGAIFDTEARAAAYSPTLLRWVVVGFNGNYVATSDNDGVNWTPRTTSVFNSGAYAVAWGQGLFVAMGSGVSSSIASYDGETWNATNAFTLQGKGVAFNNNVTNPRWIAAGLGSSTAAFSANGINWVAIGSLDLPVSVGNAVAFGKNRWVSCLL